MKLSIVPLLCFGVLIYGVNSAKILGIFHMAANSHYNLGNALMKGLANAGHDVTLIAPFVDDVPPKNGTFRNIHLSGFLEEKKENAKNMNMFEMGQSFFIFNMIFLDIWGGQATEKTLAHPNVQKLINSGEKFDVVIVEQFCNDAHKILANHFGAHLIVFSTIGPNAWVNPLVANPENPSYIASMYSGGGNKMDFLTRAKNTGIFLVQEMYRYWWYWPKQNRMVKKYFPDSKVDLYDVVRNASLVLLNSHVSMAEPVPLVPSMINIGGYHVSPPKALPKDLKDYLDNAKEGVVYFSMGSNLKSKDMPLKTRQAFLEVFAKLKQKVLWKFEADLPEKPANVKIEKWLPQQDILAHPNVKVFISHGGLLSTTETIYHGVPILALPIFGDQQLNANMAVVNGFAVKLDFHQLTAEKLEKALNEILSNPKFGENAKKRSKLMKDRENKPLDSAVYWVEYVIRNGGGELLKIAALDLSWYQLYLLDVWAFYALILIIGFYVSKKIFGLVCFCCRRKSNKDTKSKSDKKVKKN